MGRTRDLVKNIGNIKGTFHAQMGTVKDRSGKDLIEARDQEKMEKIRGKNWIKKILMNQITMMAWSVTQSQTFWSVKSSGP